MSEVIGFAESVISYTAATSMHLIPDAESVKTVEPSFCQDEGTFSVSVTGFPPEVVTEDVYKRQDQIKEQIKNAVLAGELRSGDALPSIRMLAKELRISVITTKRAYEELEREGFIETVPGKGSFVAQRNSELLREEALRRMEEALELSLIHIWNKTGMLIAAAAQLGAVAANAFDSDRQSVEKFAFDIGLVFQMVDDVLDVSATTQELGKPAHSDEAVSYTHLACRTHRKYDSVHRSGGNIRCDAVSYTHLAAFRFLCSIFSRCAARTCIRTGSVLTISHHSDSLCRRAVRDLTISRM